MRVILVFIMAIVLLTACQKNDENLTNAFQNVVFNGMDISGTGKKSTDTEACSNPTADYAKVVINDVIYNPEVFYLDGIPFTQSIKLASGSYTISEFMLINDNGTPNETEDDFIVKAAPVSGSEYAEFVGQPLSFNFDIEPFKKAEIPVEVICFDEKEYESFGFNWFAMTEITIREKVFFGDICAEDPDVYIGSIYENQDNGLQTDMPAIFRIDVYKNQSFITSYSNEDWLGEGAPLAVKYPDHDNQSDEFSFELFILIEEGGEFIYKYYHTWTFNDDEMIDAGIDEVVDFVLGDCVLNDTDLELVYGTSNPGEDPDPVEECETAYAYNEDYSICFLEIDEDGDGNGDFNRWGWTNGALSTGTYTFDVYAGAGQCNLENGYYVGILTVDYDGTEAEFSYSLFDGNIMNEVHLYAGNEMLPRKNGDFTVSSGQFPHKNDNLGGVTTYTYTFTDLSGEIYIVAHAVICPETN